MTRTSDLWWDAGCAHCRAGLTAADRVATTAGGWQVEVLRCPVCGTWWTRDPDRGGARPITEERARVLLAGEAPPRERLAPPRFRIAAERRRPALRDGLIMPPSLPPLPLVLPAIASERDEELLTMADALDLPLPHVLAYQHVVADGLHWSGWNLLVAVDALDWDLLLARMAIATDVQPWPTPGTGVGPVTAIGVLSAYEPRPRGPGEILAVGATRAGRALERARLREARRAADRSAP